MKKMIVLVAMMVMVVLSLSACGNMDIVDTVYTYDEAIVSLADGSVVRGEVQNWRDYEDGDQIQVKIDNVVYLVHSTNITLIAR